MIAVTPPPQPIALDNDPLALLLREHGDPAMLAPPLPLVVPHRCQGRKALIDTFARLHFLTLVWAEAGKRDFTAAELATVWPGGETNRQSEYLRDLCALGLVQVVGHRVIANLPPTRHPAMFRIDLASLRHASAPLVADYMRRAAVPAPRGGHRAPHDSPRTPDQPTAARTPDQPTTHADRWTAVGVGVGLRWLVIRLLDRAPASHGTPHEGSHP
jgi:hypothetical protein